MNVSRRGFLKLAGAATAAAGLTSVNIKETAAEAYYPARVHYAREVPTICTFCGVGCGIICHVQDGVIINVEGDPDHPVNEGTLCSKGSAYYNISYVYDAKGEPKRNPKRLTKPLYRGPNATDWEEVDWDWAIDEIADRIKKTRDETFIETDEGMPANRTDAINWLGSAFCTDEENYLFHKFSRAMGAVNIDHCARL